MTMSTDLNCPTCNSDATQRLSVIFEHGISDINTSSNTSGIGLGRGGLGLGLAKTKTRGTAQTAMSLKASPPPKKRLLKPLGYIFLVYFVLSLFLGHNQVLAGLAGTLWIAGSVAWIVFAVNYNSKTWPPLKAIWDDSFLCNRCNHMFQVGKKT
jgi:hypothetical protein